MNLKLIADHTIDLDMLPEAPIVLDVGCRWFDFSKEILAIRPRAVIYAFDPDPEIEDPEHPQITYFRTALVGNDRTTSSYAKYSSGEGNFLFDVGRDQMQWEGKTVPAIPFANWPVPDCVVTQVPCMWIGSLGVKFDVAKLDCEGSEFEILENWPTGLATQLNVEFHDFTGPRWHGRDAYFDRLMHTHLAGYRVVRHELSKKGEGVGHWDTLLAWQG